MREFDLLKHRVVRGAFASLLAIGGYTFAVSEVRADEQLVAQHSNPTVRLPQNAERMIAADIKYVQGVEKNPPLDIQARRSQTLNTNGIIFSLGQGVSVIVRDFSK